MKKLVALIATIGAVLHGLTVLTGCGSASGSGSGSVTDVEAPALDSQIAELDTSTAYALYCRSRRRSSLATDAMAKSGFSKVSNRSGGISDLAAAGGTVLTS